MKEYVRFITIGFLLALITALSFASGNQEGSENTQGAVTIQYWVAANDQQFKIWRESIVDFEKANPGIKVDMQKIIGDQTQIQQKIMTQLSAGTAPEVVHIDTMYVKDMAKSGQLLSLSEFQGAEELTKVFYPAVIAPLIVDDIIYGFPIRSNTIELIYNRKLFREAGLNTDKPPKTVDELVEYAKLLTKRDDQGNIEVFGFGPSFSKDPHWTVHAFSPFLWSYGATYVDYDNMKAGWAGKEGVAALELFDKLINDLKVSPVEDIEAGFGAGRLAMWINGEWKIQGLLNDYPDLDFRFATIPVVNQDQDPILPLGGRAMTVPKGCRYEEEAWKLIQWCTSKEEQLRNTRNMAGLSPRRDILDDPWFKDHPNVKLVQQDLRYVRAKYAPGLMEMNALLSDAMMETLLNGVPAEKSLANAAEQYKKILLEKTK